jgi:hypothetical protein
MEAVHYQSIRKFGKIRVFDAEFGFADCHASYESRFVKKDGCSSGQATVIAPSLPRQGVFHFSLQFFCRSENYLYLCIQIIITNNNERGAN